MAIYLYPGKILADHLSIKSHLRDAPRDTHGATADYDDTALGTGTLTVHPWRAGPDCGKFIFIFRPHSEERQTDTSVQKQWSMDRGCFLFHQKMVAF